MVSEQYGKTDCAAVYGYKNIGTSCCAGMSRGSTLVVVVDGEDGSGSADDGFDKYSTAGSGVVDVMATMAMVVNRDDVGSDGDIERYALIGNI